MCLFKFEKQVDVHLTIKKKRKKKGSLLLFLNIDNIKIKGKIMAVSITTTQQVTGTLQPVDSKGNPASVEAGTVLFSSSDENVFRVEVDPANESTVQVVAVGPGTAQLNYSADADLGEGVKTIEGFTAVEILPAQAVGFGLTFGTPEEQPGSGL